MNRTLALRPDRVLVAIALLLAVAAGAWAAGVLAPVNSSGPAANRLVRADPAAHARVSAVVARLDRARVDGRAALTRARTRSAQAAVVRRLRDAHRRSAATLGPTDDALTRALRTTGRAYGVLAAAVSDGSPARFDAARRRVRAADTALAAAVDDSLRASARRVVRSAASSTPGARWTDPMRLLVLAIVMTISAAAGFSVSGLAGPMPWRRSRSGGRPRTRASRYGARAGSTREAERGADTEAGTVWDRGGDADGAPPLVGVGGRTGMQQDRRA